MATITLHINEKTKKGKVFLDFLKQYVQDNKTVEIIQKPNKETLKAIEEVNAGKVLRASNATELIKMLND